VRDVRFEVFTAVTMKNGVFWVVREAIEIELHPYNINRERGFCLGKSWKPLIGSFKFSGYDPRALGDTVPHS
jgi:hypothetical protein